MLTRDVAFGMNLLTLAGLVLMGMSLTLSRQHRIAVPLAVALMAAGTALTFFGLHAAKP